MKHILLLMGLSSIWGCSVETGQKTATNPAQSANSSGSSENAEGVKDGSSASPSGAATASNDGVTATPVDNGPSVSAGSDAGSSTTTVDPSSSPVAGSDSKGQTTGSQANTTASSPAQVTGAYLVGALVATAEGDAKKIGLIAKKVDQRLSDDPDHYATKWSMSLASADIPASLEKSDDPAYDEILVFKGTDEEFAKLQSQISVSISVSDPSAPFGLNEVVSTSLADLFLNQTAQ